MANPNVARGLIPVRGAYGNYFNGMGNIYYVPATDANNIFVGDPVIVKQAALMRTAFQSSRSRLLALPTTSPGP
jgi:hypothetical protein